MAWYEIAQRNNHVKLSRKRHIDYSRVSSPTSPELNGIPNRASDIRITGENEGSLNESVKQPWSSSANSKTKPKCQHSDQSYGN